MKKIIGFYHIAMMNNWLDVVSDQITKLEKSGLLAASDHLEVTALGPHQQLKKLHLPEKCIVHHKDNFKSFEHVTLERIRNMSQRDDFFCYYFHTKGVSVPNHSAQHYNIPEKVEQYGLTPFHKVLANVRRWRMLMDYFIIEKWHTALSALDNHDCVGVNWETTPFRHFAGNYWWSKSQYLNTLESVNALNCGIFKTEEETRRHQAEAWIGQRDDVKIKSLYQGTANYWEAPAPKTYRN